MKVSKNIPGALFAFAILFLVFATGPTACGGDEAPDFNDTSDTDTDADSDTDTDSNSDSDSDTDTDTDADTDSDTDTDTEPDLVTLTVTVPNTFGGVPEIIASYFFDSLPPQGYPSGYGDTYNNPAIGPGTPYEYVTDQTGLTGQYYMAVTLFCEGGGGGMYPVKGVDWIGAVMTPLTLGPGTGTVDAGEIELFLYTGY